MERSRSWRLTRPLRFAYDALRSISHVVKRKPHHQTLTQTLTLHLAPVSVVIPCHNYGRFLADTIESVLRQTVRPAEIVVVDDASDDDTHAVAERFASRGVRYVRGEWRCVGDARNCGAQETRSPFLLFLDADDQLTPDYIERCLACMENDPWVAVAYGDVQEFSDSAQFLLAPAFDPLLLSRCNFISSHALLRRQVFEMVGGYRDFHNAHEDWDLYRRMLIAPWTARHVDATVLYRRHPGSRLQRYFRESPPYARHASLAETDLTVFTPFAGKRATFDRYLAGLRALGHNPEHLHLHWYDTSGDADFGSMLRQELTRLPAASTTYTAAALPALWEHSFDTLSSGRLNNTNRAAYYYEMAVVRAYNEMLRTCQTEYVLTIEDDMQVRPETARLLLETMDPTIVAVVAPYRFVDKDQYVIWHTDPNGVTHYAQQLRSGVEDVGGSGFGCTLFRTAALRKNPIRTELPTCADNCFDHRAYRDLRQLGRVVCRWDAEAKHLHPSPAPSFALA